MSNYCAHGVSDANLDVLDPYRRGKGGVAIMWRKDLDIHITLLPIDSDRIVGISVELERKIFVTILAAYLPSSKADISAYTECLHLLRDLYVMYSEGTTVTYWLI
jgi:exonuclease III